ncbi:hypothetical protein OEZ85_006206 [Tetradesmus obliquus]|uniref:2Fe-2S ferredoxin-type domain-containing protein n=1 Tax=Tetradesmus obliquus TaxID=3088 RepID=A0ABY8TU85_TETOB|nr:hypothetical protein OEZ85_006206 [Tetradesmus obliquus]
MRVVSGLATGTATYRPLAARSAWWGPGSRYLCTVRSQRTAGDTDTNAASSSSSSSAAGSTDAPAGSCSISYRGHQFTAPQGSKLRSAMLLAGVSPHNGKAQLINCRGLGTCGTCAVEIRGEVAPASWTAAEQLRLNFPPHKPPNNQRLRLACQVACVGAELAVTKRDRFWGQGDAVLGPAGPGEFSLPLGELEFLLDSDRRQQQQHKQ